MLLKNLIRGLLNESVSIGEINSALDTHKRVIITYHTKGEDKHIGARVIEVYAYGLTKAGNPVIRAFEPYGDTTTKVPRWKFFRLDRISSWKETEQTFDRPASFFYKNLGDFNPNGDETMSIVYKITSFDNETPTAVSSSPMMSNGKTKSDNDVYKTDTERRMERLRQQLNSPITLDDLKKAYDNSQKSSEPEVEEPEQNNSDDNKGEEVFKTDTERRMERLRQQLQNPKKLAGYGDEPKDVDTTTNDTNKENQTSQDEPMSFADFNNKLADKEEPKKDDVFKTDTENNLEKLRQQLKNPKKIDLSKIPKR